MDCRCGNHLSLKNTLYNTVTQLEGTKNKCLQCFFGGPTQYHTRTFDREDLLRTRKYLKDNKMKLYVHCPYVINLAREGDEGIITKSRASLEKVIDTLHQIGPELTGGVLHIGAKGTIGRVVRELNDIDLKAPIYLENCAGEGSKIGKNIDELRLLAEGLDKPIFLCIDTCHAWASKMCDFREMNQVEKLFEDLEFCKKENLIFHLNDAISDYGSCLDRHGVLCYSKIWNLHKPETLLTLGRFYQLAKSGGHDIIFETPNPVTNYFETEYWDQI